jgi:FlaG/FlaF family flagellin (archaellin)
MGMKKVLFFLILASATFNSLAQAVNKYGNIVTDVRFFMDRYGVEGNLTAVDRYGSPVVIADLSTTPISGIGSTTATSGGYVFRFAASVVSSRGICWSTSPLPTTANSVILNVDATETYTSEMTGLIAGTTYYVRAFAVDIDGTTYGNTLTFTTLDSANLSLPNLGLAGSFGILSKSGITNVYKSTITGNVGTSPIAGTALLVACDEVVGTIYTVNDAGPACRVVNASLLTTAILDMEAAYTDLSGRSNPDFINLYAGNVGGQTIAPGLYKWNSTLTIPLDITLAGGANDIWIFQISGTLDLASAKRVILTGGAKAKNIFWVVAGAVTLGTYSHFEGTILGKTSLSLQTGASMNGRLLAQTAVTLQMNTITRP